MAGQRFCGGENDLEFERCQDGPNREGPLVWDCRIVGEMPASDVDWVGSRIEKFNPVRSFTILVEQGVIVVGYELTDDDIIRRWHGYDSVQFDAVISGEFCE